MSKPDGSISDSGIASAEPDACGLEFQSQGATEARFVTSDRSKVLKIGRRELPNPVQLAALKMSSASTLDSGGSEEKTDG